ncbi:MAG: membrane protein insertase YidC [Bacteroidota bacterium]|nr:membrane protein insertase YidC [Bacteroidota bacterium]MDP4227222.1 membrane protein insertase YidC [Bacteroidota bacterium]MDP4274351.1 membrane protein insertase YidC [Bacteroidota bacterium]
MDRNSVIGIILITLILIFFGYLSKPSKQQLELAKRQQDSIEKVRIQEAQKNIQGQSAKAAALATQKDSTKKQDLQSLYGGFAQAAEGEKSYVSLENNLVKLVISSKGGRIYSAQLKKYSTYDNLPLVLFNGDSTTFGLNFFAQNRSISTNQLFFTPTTTEKNQVVTQTSREVKMRLYADSTKSRYIEYVYSLAPNSYMVNFKINLQGMNKVFPANQNTLDLKWDVFVPRLEKGAQNESNYTTLYYKFFQDEVDYFNPRSSKGAESKDLTKLKWLAYKQQFFSSVLIANDYFTNATVKAETLKDQSKYLKRFRSEIGIPFNNQDKVSIPLSFYFGPNHYKTLRQYHLDLEELVTLGKNIIKWINRFGIIPIFNFLGTFIGSYGIIILILTIIIKMILFPLTYKSYLSTAKMRVLKPQIDEINAKYPKEKAMERQQATMALYKKVGVSPMGGCLPALLQMPILIAMFRFFPTSIELRHQSFLWAKDLSTYDSILNLPFSIPFYGDHVSLFTILMTVTTIISIKINDQDNAQSSQMPGMKTMMYIMPVMFMFMFNSFSAALTYYYFLVNIISFGMNALFKHYVNDEEVLKKLHENKKKPVKKSKFQARLEEMAKQQGYRKR